MQYLFGEIKLGHPGFHYNEADLLMVRDDSEKKIFRVEYPDGVIFVIQNFGDDVNVSSNRKFIINENNVVTPNLYHIDAEFKDVI